MVKKLPANARNAGSIPGPGRYHEPWGNQARGPPLLSLRACSEAKGPPAESSLAQQLENSLHSPHSLSK